MEMTSLTKSKVGCLDVDNQLGEIHQDINIILENVDSSCTFMQMRVSYCHLS